MRVLLATDDESLRFHWTVMLEAERFEVESVEIDDDLADVIRHGSWNAVAFDADTVAPSVIRELRRAGGRLPLLATTMESGAKHRARLLEIGADDALTVPADSDEIVARLRALIRRSAGHAQNIVMAGPVAVNLENQTVSLDGAPIYLTSHEWAVMELLALRKGLTVSKDALMNHLYGGMDEPEPKIVDVFICKIRRKLGDAKTVVETTWGRGYRLRVGDEKLPPPSKAPKSFIGRAPVLTRRVLEHLALGPADQRSLVEHTKVEPFQVPNAIARAKVRGLVASRREALGSGGFGPAIYSITDAGRAWLAQFATEAA